MYLREFVSPKTHDGGLTTPSPISLLGSSVIHIEGFLVSYKGSVKVLP